MIRLRYRFCDIWNCAYCLLINQSLMLLFCYKFEYSGGKININGTYSSSLFVCVKMLQMQLMTFCSVFECKKKPLFPILSPEKIIEMFQKCYFDVKYSCSSAEGIVIFECSHGLKQTNKQTYNQDNQTFISILDYP